jgi:hypothetical protein
MYMLQTQMNQYDVNWVTERISTNQFPRGFNTDDFMHPDSSDLPNSHDVSYWVTKGTFRQLAQLGDELRSADDPRVIGISGIISENGTASFISLKRFNDIIDIPLDNAGTCTLAYQDGSRNILA